MDVTIKDISRRANVSAMTVSRVLNPRSQASVAEATRERVLSIAREMGYAANPAARALATGRTYAVGLWVPRVSASYYASVIHRVHRLARADGYEVVLRETPHSRPDVDAMRRTAQHVDGIFLYDSGTWVDDYRDAGLHRRTLFVSAGAVLDDAPLDIGIDLYPAAHAAMEHLVAGGRRQIAYSANAGSLEGGADPRKRAYDEVMREAGLAPQCIALEDETRAAARRAFRELALRGGDLPDAVFCRSDEIALGIHRAAHVLGLLVPDDLSLVGGDGIEDTEYHVPAISTIRQPIEDVCRRAWDLFRERLADPETPGEPHRFVAEFVPRESSRLL